MRLPSPWSALLLCLCVAVAGSVVAVAIGQEPKAEHPDGFQVVTMTTGKGQVVVYTPTEIERPAMTGDRGYVLLDCFDAAGRRLVGMRQPWPSMPPFHFHVPVPKAVVQRVETCRLSGMPTPFEIAVVRGPRDGKHPIGPPGDPAAIVDPLKPAE